MRPRLRVAALLTLALAMPACGGFVKSGSKPDPTTSAPPEQVGAGVDLDALAPSSTAVPPSSTAPTRSPAPTTAEGPLSENPVRRDDPAGFRLTLAVDGDLRFNADESFTMRLEVTNMSRQPRRYDPNQKNYFVMEGAGRWRDSDCGPLAKEREPAKTLAPGDTAVFTARYPGPSDRLDGGDACRRPEGDYVLGAGFNWCPDDSVDVNGVCDAAATETAKSSGIRIRLG